MTPGQSHIAQAIAAMEEERTNLAARLQKVDALIADMREAFHLPSAQAPRRAKKAAPLLVGGPATRVKRERAEPRSELGKGILAALSKGPLSPRELAAKTGAMQGGVKYQMKKLERAGLVVCTGTTNSRRVALAGAPAKEAP